jgi:hypothetical protein
MMPITSITNAKFCRWSYVLNFDNNENLNFEQIQSDYWSLIEVIFDQMAINAGSTATLVIFSSDVYHDVGDPTICEDVFDIYDAVYLASRAAFDLITSSMARGWYDIEGGE